MTPVTRKIVTIVTEAIVERELTEMLDQVGVAGYTITDARGRGHRGKRTANWDHTANIRVEVLCDAKLAETISNQLREKWYDHYAMVLYIADVEVLRPEKFNSTSE